MPDQTTKRPRDALAVCEAIETFLSGSSLSVYREEYGLRLQIERLLEIIGEALNRLRKISPAVIAQISECNRIIAFRNVLAHGYDVVDDLISWDIVQTKLPILRDEISRLIQAES